MNYLLKQTSRLVVLTLIAGLLVIPTYPVWAEDLVEAPTLEPVPMAETVSVDLPAEPVPVDQTVVADPVVTEIIVDPAPELISIPTQTTIESESPVAETIMTVEILTPATSDPVIDGELDFTTAIDSIVPNDNLAISGEFGTDNILPADNLAISDELGGETTGAPLIDKAEISLELNFTTLSVAVETLAISDENSFTTLSVAIDTLTVSSELNFSTQPALADTTAVSNEMSFNTQTVPVDTLSVSQELSFNTLPADTDHFTISGEMSFITASVPVDKLAVSSERSFTTETGGVIDQSSVSQELSFNTLSLPVDKLAVSNEYSFTTLTIPTEILTVSSEMSFTTLPVPIDTLSVSSELSFVTTPNPINILTVSDEQSFTTESGTTPPPPVTPPGGGGGCHGSGCGGSSIISVTPLPYACTIFLKKFIKYGEANDRFEVIKLQVFLRVFEGFKNLKVTGVYDLPTYQAVEVFQKRYSRDVLGPWGISDSTGYVYITTRLAINNIFCGRNTRNDLYLRLYEEYNREYQQVINEWPSATSTEEGYYLVPTTTASTSPITKTNFLLAGVGSLLDFISANFCWVINLLLLLLILFLLWLLWLTNREEEEVSQDKLEELPAPSSSIDDHLIGAIPLEDILTSDDEEALEAIIDEEEEQLPAANNNPEQETILLGPEVIQTEGEQVSKLDKSA